MVWNAARGERGDEHFGPGRVVSGTSSETPAGVAISGLTLHSQTTSHMLKTVVLARDLEVVGEGWFCEASITSITIPAKVREIQDDAFRNCFSLATLDIPPESRLVRIGVRAFYNTGIGQFVSPAGFRELGQGAFYNCPHLTRVWLNIGLEELGTQN